jgi:hypothetical protein
MLSFNFIKFFGVFALALVISSACRFWQNASDEKPSPTPFTAEEIVSEIPFSTREPEIFQVEIVMTANGSENKIFAARNGSNRRFDYNAGAKNQVSAVQADKNYLIIQSKKVYTESAAENVFDAENRTDFLTTGWLSAKPDAKFFKEGAENNLLKYRVTFGEAENLKSETLIFIDESVNLPVRQEFYSIDGGGQKTLTMTIELKNLKLEAGADLFAVPRDYKKISPEEFRAILKKENE